MQPRPRRTGCSAPRPPASAAARRRSQRGEQDERGPVDDREHDADADAVERAAAARGDGERNGEQRHDDGHEREGDLALQRHQSARHRRRWRSSARCTPAARRRSSARRRAIGLEVVRRARWAGPVDQTARTSPTSRAPASAPAQTHASSRPARSSRTRWPGSGRRRSHSPSPRAPGRGRRPGTPTAW